MRLPHAGKQQTANPHPPAKSSLKASLRARAFRVGGYSVAATLLVLAIAIAVNVLFSALPSRLTQLDTTANQLYSLSEQTQNLVAGLEDEVTVYWIVQSGNEDSRVELLLEQYAALSHQLTVEKVDPDVHPTFLRQYELSGVYNNSLLVALGDRYRYVSYYDIYQYDYTTYETGFAGEGSLTSAIDYVTSDDLPKLYLLTGHGESELSATFSDGVEGQNIQTESLSLLSLESVPEDADAILINDPQRDLSEDEVEKLRSYLEEGGSLVLLTSPLAEGERLANLYALLEQDYGVSAADGMVMEGDSNHTYYGYPYYLLPNLLSHTITSPLISAGYYVLLPTAHGLTVAGQTPEGASVSQLLTTSDSAYSKPDVYSAATLDREEGDVDGPFALGVAITDEIDDDTTSRVVWFSSSYLVDDTTNLMISGGNQDLFLNALGWALDQEDSVSIHAKSLSYDYLTINSATASMLAVVVVGVIPLACLGVGIYLWIRRKRG